jgi:Flp pilus assembly protein TadB
MPPYKKPSIEEILNRHGARIENQIRTSKVENVNYSREYIKFKDEMFSELSRFERWCKSLGSIIKLNVSEKDSEKVRRQLEIAHLDVEPWQALTLGVMTFLGVFVLGLLISLAYILIKGSFAAFPFLFFFLMIVLALFLFYFVNGYPARLANKWRLKASSQMVPAILYIVVYMRHTPNLEKAIAFASEHLQYPLSLDFKKVFYEVSVGKFSTIKESLDNYLETWRDYSTEFIEAFHLIESSLFEPDNNRRILILEKSLQVVLDGVYDKMLRFTHNVRTPLTNVYMLGVVLPTLGLALLPLASAMVGDYLRWIHVFILFNLIVPFFVFYLTDKIMILRPGGYGESTLLERNPLYTQYKSRAPYFNAFLICLPFFIIGFLPLIFQYTPIPGYLGLQQDYSFTELGLSILGDESFFGFVEGGNRFAGPFGIGALILGMFIPFGVALFFSMAFSNKTKKLIIERERTRQLEREFNNSLFQLGNRMGNGVPPELVFARVAESSKGLITQDFFRRVNYNIQQMGMSVEKAIFDPNRGGIIYYPSDLIATSMKVLIESSKKGLKVAAISLMSISEYVKNIHKITNRLKDMLAEIISDMKSNMTFLAPLLSGIVVGLAAMITIILKKMDISNLGDSGVAGIGNMGAVLQIFDLTKMIPPYYLQIIIGIYLVQIIFILTNTLVAVDSGEDKLEKTNKTGKNLKRGILLYFVTALFSTLALFVLATIVLGSLGS